MGEIYIPFTKGQSEGVDPKLVSQLPSSSQMAGMPPPTPGLFTSTQNVRYAKDGRLASRFGYAFISGSQGQMIGAGDFGDKRTIYVQERAGVTQPPIVWDRQQNGVYVQAGATSGTFRTGSLSAPRRTASARNLQYNCSASDISYISDVIFLAYCDFNELTSASRGLFVNICDALTGTPFVSYQVDVNGTNPKLVVAGSAVYLLYNVIGGDDIKFVKYDNTGTSLATGTVVTAAAGFGLYFDASLVDSTQFLLVYQSGGLVLNWGLVNTSTNVFTSKATQVTALASVRPSIVRGSSGNVALVWEEGGSLVAGNTHYRVDTIAGVSVIAKTTLYNGGNAEGFPTAGLNTIDDYSFAWNRVSTGTTSVMDVFTAGKTVQSLGVVAVSRPFMGPNNACYVWTANFATYPGFGTLLFASYKLVDIESVQVRNEGATCELVCCQQQAVAGYVTAFNGIAQFETRRNTVAISNNALAPSTTAYAAFLPVVTKSASFGIDLVARAGADLVRFESSPWGNRLLPANLNGQLFFSGARMWEFDGNSFYESGLGDGPEVLSLANAGAGTIIAGTYQYCLVHEWSDAKGRRHRSPPSYTQTITFGGNSNVTVTYSFPAFSARFSAQRPGVVTNIYRTLAGGSTFFLVNSTTTNIITTSNYDPTLYTFTDSSADTAISSNEKLYTQGNRGGLSGILQNDEPPPCRFLWAGNNRLIMGGLEEVSEVQWSKLVFSGEPVQFANNVAFKARIDGEVTGVACLDGVWHVGSRTSIFTFSGEGPDDNGAGGDFGDPHKLPADIGFYSQRSFVEVPEGLLFQGRADRIYLLPRGGGTPQWIGQPIRDTLAAYPFITAVKLIPEESLVYFSCINTAGTDGRILVYDTRIKQWYVDIPFQGAFAYASRCLNNYNGKLVIDGRIAETSAWADDEDGTHNRPIQTILVTGDIRPFGLGGWGRIPKISLLGEIRNSTNGQIYAIIYQPDNPAGSDSGDFPTWPLATLVSDGAVTGNAFEVEHFVVNPKRDVLRLQFGFAPSSPSEGVVFNGLSLQANGQKELRRKGVASRG